MEPAVWWERGWAREERPVSSCRWHTAWTVWQGELELWVRDLSWLWPWLCHLGLVLGFSFFLYPKSPRSLRASVRLVENWQGPGWAGRAGARKQFARLFVGIKAGCSLCIDRGHLSGRAEHVLGRKSHWAGQELRGFQRGGQVPSVVL